jgi:osmotically-inducible protein OsmY
MLETAGASLNDRVGTAITTNPYLTGKKLRFEAHQGRVVLRGVVGSYFQKQMAQESLRGVEGVEQIENELEVLWS